MKTVTDFLQVVLDQSQQALKKNEIPVGAVIYDPKKMKLNKIKYFAVGRTV